nr:hypothetical protein [Pandoravirus massiliensis]
MTGRPVAPSPGLAGRVASAFVPGPALPRCHYGICPFSFFSQKKMCAARRGCMVRAVPTGASPIATSFDNFFCCGAIKYRLAIDTSAGGVNTPTRHMYRPHPPFVAFFLSQTFATAFFSYCSHETTLLARPRGVNAKAGQRQK